MCPSIFLQVLRTAVGHRLAKVQGYLFRSAFLRRIPTFTRLIIENLLLCFLQSTLYQTSKYLTGSLGLRFKKILTDLVHADYFEVCWVIKLDLQSHAFFVPCYFKFYYSVFPNEITHFLSGVQLPCKNHVALCLSDHIELIGSTMMGSSQHFSFLYQPYAYVNMLYVEIMDQPIMFPKHNKFGSQLGSDELKIAKFWKINT